MISHKLKYIFIHIPKNGGNSLQTFLKDTCDNTLKTQESPVSKNGGLKVFCEKRPNIDIKHSFLKDYYILYENKIVNNYTKFTIVRNPYDRAISFYFFRKGKLHTTFNRDEFIYFYKTGKLWKPKDAKFDSGVRTNQIEYLMYRGKVCMDYIIRFENLKEDLEKLPFMEKMNLDSYPHLNASKRSHYRDYYDEETKSLIEKTFKKDFDYFKYEF